MKIRKVLIIITSSIIVLMFILVSSISYNLGISYGEENAEKIRENRTSNNSTYKKAIKGVNVINIKNKNIPSKIFSSGRVLSLNNITILSEVQGRIVGNSTFKKGTEFKKGEIIFNVNNSDLKLLINAKKSRFMNLVSSVLADIKLDFNNEYTKWNNFFNNIEIDSNLPNFPEINNSKEKNYIISRSILS